MLEKPIKAANEFNKANEKIKLICAGGLKIVSNKENKNLRPDTYHYPIEILQQKFFLQLGFWAKKINNPNGAIKNFKEALFIHKIYDPRIHRQCLV